MKVSLNTYGGIAATTKAARGPDVVDSADLGSEVKEELDRLVDAARRKAPKTTQPSRPDAMSYAITIEDADQSDTIEAADGDVPEEFAQLRSFVRQHKRS
jgi:hypothetical protein